MPKKSRPAAPSPKAKRTQADPSEEAAPGRLRYGLFLRNLLLAAVPVAVVWFFLTPLLDNLLRVGGEALVHLTEIPNVTDLLPAVSDSHYALVHRLDFPPARRAVSSFRVTDIHFPWVILGALFLAVPGVPLKERFRRLSWAGLAMLAFQFILVLFWVKFIYATQLGDWSLENYSAFARNFWGLGKHVLDLPIKLALPFALWVAAYLDRLLPGRDETLNG